MAGGGHFLNRVLAYVVNEVVVNGLANSPAFQRFAVRTSRRIGDMSRRIEDVSNMARQKGQDLTEQMKDLSKNFEQSKER